MNAKDKVRVYEEFLHKLSLYCTCCEGNGIAELVQNADRWSYAHRVGEGDYSEKNRQKSIDWLTKILCDTPATDRIVADRQKNYSVVDTVN